MNEFFINLILFVSLKVFLVFSLLLNKIGFILLYVTTCAEVTLLCKGEFQTTIVLVYVTEWKGVIGRSYKKL